SSLTQLSLHRAVGIRPRAVLCSALRKQSLNGDAAPLQLVTSPKAIASAAADDNRCPLTASRGTSGSLPSRKRNRRPTFVRPEAAANACDTLTLVDEPRGGSAMSPKTMFTGIALLAGMLGTAMTFAQSSPPPSPREQEVEALVNKAAALI